MTYMPRSLQPATTNLALKRGVAGPTGPTLFAQYERLLMDTSRVAPLLTSVLLTFRKRLIK